MSSHVDDDGDDPQTNASVENTDENDSKNSSTNEKTNDKTSSAGGKFECNICLDPAQDPVVSQCGHLFWFAKRIFVMFHQAHFLFAFVCIVGLVFIRFV